MDRDGLRRRLRELNVPFRDDGALVIELNGRTAHEIVRSIDEPLTVLRTESPSLEEAYLRILAAGDE
ncbi:MAG: hypothetical protein E6I69_00050 [Chloroflexi bacterium]|nr:MAG: hypothetical protein E6I69_00050 [Chloroflexota bacterium]